MSIKNFVPEVWAAKIDKNLKEYLTLWDFCNHEYEGEIKKAGDTVRIQHVVRPTITTTTDGAEIVLSGAEKIKGGTVSMPVKRQSYFDYYVYDVDKAQALGNLETELKEETTQGIANELDMGIASLAADTAATKLYTAGSEPTVVAGTASAGEKNVLDIIDEAVEKLYEANVPTNEPIEMAITPKFYSIFKKEYLKLDTNNHDELKKGILGMYGNVQIRLTNNAYKSGGVDYLMVRTKGAIAAVKALTNTEAYRPESGFQDAVKGLTVWDRKIVRPKELIVANVTY